MDQERYEQIKAQLKQERDHASEIFSTWRICFKCNAYPGSGYCDHHREAMDRSQNAKQKLRKHIHDNVPESLRPPTRYETMRNRLQRWGRTPVWNEGDPIRDRRS